MRICLIYELIPEETQVWLVETDDEETIARLKKAHFTFMNYESQNEHTEFVSDWMNRIYEAKCEAEERLPNAKVAVRSYTFDEAVLTRIDDKRPLENADLVIVTGFGL